MFYQLLEQAVKNNILNAADIDAEAQRVNDYFYGLSNPGYVADDTPGPVTLESQGPIASEAPSPYTIGTGEDAYQLTGSDTDALQHFYGSQIVADKYGVGKSILSGLAHEFEGILERHSAEAIGKDFLNNISGIFMGDNAPKYNTDELYRLLEKNHSYNFYGGNPLTLDEKTILDGLLQYGLDWTMDPPENSRSNPQFMNAY